MKTYRHFIVFKFIVITVFILSMNLSNAANCLNYPYYIVDQHYFRITDVLDKLVTKQNFDSRIDYLNNRFGQSNWEIRDGYFSLKLPEIIESTHQFEFSEKFSATNHSNKIIVVAEIFYKQEKIYMELLKLNVDSKINQYTARFDVPFTSNIFVVHETGDKKYIVSRMKKILISNLICYQRVRSYSDAIDLNTEACNKFSGNTEVMLRSCKLVEKYKNRNR